MNHGTVLDFKGKRATAGPQCLYHLTTGQILYAESVKETDDAYVFDGDHTLLLVLTPNPQRPGSMEISMTKLSQTGFKPLVCRVPKTIVAMVQDCGEEAVVQKAHEALSGLTLPGNAVN